MGIDWGDKKVLVTGGSGFIGSFLVENLLEKGADVFISKRKSSNEDKISHIKNKITILEGDLTNEDFVKDITKDKDVIFHLASIKKNIKFQKENPATILKSNTLMSLNILEYSKKHNIEKVLIMSSGIVSINSSYDFNDNQFGYGWSKKYSEILSSTYKKESDMDIFIVRPQNTFGPRDDFNTSTAQIIPTFISKVFNKDNPFVIWGDGTQKKSFVYVKDVADSAVKFLEEGSSDCDYVDFVSDEIISVKKLAELIIDLSNVDLNIEFDESKPVGDDFKIQPKTSCGNFSFNPSYSLKKGLEETINWYKNNEQ